MIERGDSCWRIFYISTVSTFAIVLLSGCIGTSDSDVATDSDKPEHPERIPDYLFSTSVVLHGRNVTCDNMADGSYKFPSETWSCYNIRIDGIPLRLYYVPEKNVKAHCTDYEMGKHDLGALCRQLLEAHDIGGELWTVLIVKNPTCTKSEGERAMFVKSNSTFSWVTQTGIGFVQTLRCMLK